MFVSKKANATTYLQCTYVLSFLKFIFVRSFRVVLMWSRNWTVVPKGSKIAQYTPRVRLGVKRPILSSFAC